MAGSTRFHHSTTVVSFIVLHTKPALRAGTEGGHCHDECHLNSSVFMCHIKEPGLMLSSGVAFA